MGRLHLGHVTGAGQLLALSDLACKPLCLFVERFNPATRLGLPGGQLNSASY